MQQKLKKERTEELKNKKILLTGGHAATTALSTIEELIRRKKDANWNLIWIGSKKAIEGKRIQSLESQVFTKMGLKTYSIISGRLQRKFTLWTIPSLIKVPFGFINAFLLILKLRPKVVVSFGGYAALPVVFSSWLLRVPVVIHEQTAAIGLANKLSLPFADKICLGREESRKFCHKKNCILVGNPIMTQIAEIETKEKIGNPPTVFITLGSRGSQIVNKIIYEILDILLKKYRVVHITGETDFDKFAKVQNKNYEVYPTVDPLAIDNLYRQADIVVARAGANTVSEIIVTGRPALLIPIPWSYLDEQKKNALVAQEIGIARILEQSKLSGETMLSEINSLIEDWPNMIKKAKQKDNDILDREASRRLVDQILKFVN